jgi:replication factor C subunit 1
MTYKGQKRELDDVLKQEAKRVMSVADFFRRGVSGPTEKPPPVVKREASPVKAVVKTEPVESPQKTKKSTNLEGKTLVFTGNMSIDREKAVDMAVAAGAKVTSAVSGKTSYLVVGSVLEDGRAIEEGSKYRKMKQLRSEGKAGPTMLNEEEFLNLLGHSGGISVAKETLPTKAAVRPVSTGTSIPALWVDKYEPTSLKEYVGNSSTVKKVLDWLSRWKNSGHSKPSGGYKPSNYPGRGGNTEAKAILLSGPPGIGKTLLARLACMETGFQPVEYNASDYRSKSAVELIASTLSGSAFTFAYTASEKHPKGLVGLAHQCLVMDECDGMSAGDRGGNQALIQLIKKSSIPVICICNDRMSPKVRSLANHCYDLKMTRPTRSEVVARANQILAAEGMRDQVPQSLVEQIVDGSDCDIRQVVNQLEGDSFHWKSTVLSYERKDRSTMLTAFEACRLILSPKPEMTVTDRLDMFFVDYDLIPLMMQQNYLKCFQPGDLKKIPRSAQLLSFGDVISRNIRAEQNWTLLSEFGLIGNVFVPPKMEPGFSPFPEFPMWLGKYSTTRKSARIAQELECVVSSASTVTARNILTSNYAHVLYGHFVKELGKAASDSTRGDNVELPTLDRFGVNKNDLLELLTELLLPWQEDIFAERFDAKTKASITRICNAHHMALKSGGAHFRHLKSAGGGGVALSLAVSDERADSVKAESASVSENEGEDGESKAVKKEAEALVKVATSKKAAAKKTKSKKSS